MNPQSILLSFFPQYIKDQNSSNLAKHLRYQPLMRIEMRWIHIFVALRGMLLLRDGREINGLPI